VCGGPGRFASRITLFYLIKSSGAPALPRSGRGPIRVIFRSYTVHRRHIRYAYFYHAPRRNFVVGWYGRGTHRHPLTPYPRSSPVPRAVSQDPSLRATVPPRTLEKLPVDGTSKQCQGGFAIVCVSRVAYHGRSKRSVTPRLYPGPDCQCHRRRCRHVLSAACSPP
jgi:hypothetical protein